jgi:hypothetical protein
MASSENKTSLSDTTCHNSNQSLPKPQEKTLVYNKKDNNFKILKSKSFKQFKMNKNK